MRTGQMAHEVGRAEDQGAVDDLQALLPDRAEETAVLQIRVPCHQR
jgi:hypothetical protein